MFELTQKAHSWLKNDVQLRSLIALNLGVTQQTVERWLRDNNTMLTTYTALRTISLAKHVGIEDLVTAKGHVYEPVTTGH